MENSKPGDDWTSMFSGFCLGKICADYPSCADQYNSSVAMKVVGTTQLFHFTFLDVPDRGDKEATPTTFDYPTVLYLIGKGFQGENGQLTIYAHGHMLPHVYKNLKEKSDGIPVSIAASKVYGYVLGLSAAMNSLHLQAAVLHGKATIVEDRKEMKSALEGIVNGFVPHRWDHTCQPRDFEYNLVRLIRVKIDAPESLKYSHTHEHLARLGVEWEEDWKNKDIDYWEGSIPVWEEYGVPHTGPHNKATGVPAHVMDFIATKNYTNRGLSYDMATQEHSKDGSLLERPKDSP